MRTSAPDRPEVAVIIGAFRRREFLRQAVRSVLAQTLPRDRFEVVVLKDFLDDELDGALAADGVTTIQDTEPRIGRWLLRAFRATTAPLIALLDDDDEWEPDRLARAVAVLHEHPEVGLYRNRVRVIDRHGAPVPADRWRRLESDLAFDVSGPVRIPPGPKAGLVEFASVRTRVTFNSSTMVVRRELLEGAWGEAFATTQLPDLTLFLVAALGPSGLYFDDRRLTRFRRYDGNVTLRSGWLAEASRSYREGADLARAHHRADFENWLRAAAAQYGRQFRASELFESIAANGSRAHVARLTAAYLGFSVRHPTGRGGIGDVGATGIYGLAYCLAPGMTRRARAARTPAVEPRAS